VPRLGCEGFELVGARRDRRFGHAHGRGTTLQAATGLGIEVDHDVASLARRGCTEEQEPLSPARHCKNQRFAAALVPPRWGGVLLGSGFGRGVALAATDDESAGIEAALRFSQKGAGFANRATVHDAPVKRPILQRAGTLGAVVMAMGSGHRLPVRKPWQVFGI
jgi:hypothetical protein